jgi:hypothetical protein
LEKKKTLPHQKFSSIIFKKMNFLENMDIPPTPPNNDKKGKMDFKISLRKWKIWPTKKKCNKKGQSKKGGQIYHAFKMLIMKVKTWALTYLPRFLLVSNSY